jgi:zinc transporter ZupT
MWPWFWIVGGLTAVLFIGAGGMKLIRPKDALYKMGLKWTEDFSANQIKLIATAEVLGGIGVILPILLNVLPVLSPIAAGALAALMIAASITHIHRKEFPANFPLILLAAAACVLGILILSK